VLGRDETGLLKQVCRIGRFRDNEHRSRIDEVLPNNDRNATEEKPLSFGQQVFGLRYLMLASWWAQITLRRTAEIMQSHFQYCSINL
jgi:hypothetical protein